MRPHIQSTLFGSIKIGGRRYLTDVVVRLDGSVEKRRKNLSKRLYGTSHVISLEEAIHVYQDGAEQLIIGTGRFDSVRLSDEAATYLDEQGCRSTLVRTPDSPTIWNETSGKVIGLFHVTC